MEFSKWRPRQKLWSAECECACMVGSEGARAFVQGPQGTVVKRPARDPSPHMMSWSGFKGLSFSSRPFSLLSPLTGESAPIEDSRGV